jgi:hypothetical protein
MRVIFASFLGLVCGDDHPVYLMMGAEAARDHVSALPNNGTAWMTSGNPILDVPAPGGHRHAEAS